MPERITMTAIARQAGVSKNTVSLALRQSSQIPEKTRLRIEKIAKKLGYHKNAVVAQLMAELRSSSGSGKPVAGLALINANLDRHALKRHPTLPAYVEGCRRHARQLGYNLDEFWLHDPELDVERLKKILSTRGIRGGVVVGLMKENRLPATFAPLWDSFPCVVTGVRTRDPALSFACVDHHMLAYQAFQKAMELGYQRPALVLDGSIDRLVDGRFSSGVLIAQQSLSSVKRCRAFYQVEEARKNPELFRTWLEKEKPDLILTLYNVVKTWVQDLGYSVPDEMGLIQLEWRKDRPEWAGMNQHNDIAGECAIEMVVGMIHHHSAAKPLFPRATLTSGTWVDGKTVKIG